MCKYAGVHYFYNRFSCAVAALSELEKSRNKKDAAEARGLLHQLQSFDVLFTLWLPHDLLGNTVTVTSAAVCISRLIQTRYRGKLFAVVDELISELDRRFTTHE